MKGLGCYFVVVVKSLSHIHLFCDPMDCSQPGSLSMEFSRQEYWSGLPFTPLGYLPNSGIKLTSLASPPWQKDSLLSSNLGSQQGATLAVYNFLELSSITVTHLSGIPKYHCVFERI